MASRKFKGFKFWLKVFIISLCIVFVIRTFLIEPYVVSSSQMETALLKGDRVLVNKTSYGIRLPMTWLTIPFTFDSFFGIRSYSTLLETGYHRLFYKHINRNDVVLFNNPIEVDKPLDKRSLFLSRCVAIAGDTIDVKGSDFCINGKIYASSPDILMSFKYLNHARDSIKLVMNSLDIPLRISTMDTIYTHIQLSRYEAFLLNQTLPDSFLLSVDEEEILPDYRLIVPARGMIVGLDTFNISLYREIIENEVDGNLELKNSRLSLNGKTLFSHEFKNDYYWFLSDNINEATDSRTFGFISEQNIIGKASFVWFSSDSSGIKTNRIFKSVK